MPPTMMKRHASSRAAAIAVALSGLVLLGAAPSQSSVTINYDVLESLPHLKRGKPAPKLRPLAMVRPAPKTDLYVGRVENPPRYTHAVPPAFAVEGRLAHGLDVAAAESGLSEILVPPVVPRALPPKAVPRAPESPAAAPEARPSAVREPSGWTGAVREREVAMAEPPRETPPAPPPAANAKAPRFVNEGVPPVIAWNEHSPLGAVRFAAGGVDVMDIERASLPQLDALAEEFRNSGRRVLLKAFAGGVGDKSHEAHRLALRRGLAVRRYLISKGVPSTKIDVRAVGGATDGGALDRVDVVAAAS